MHMEGGEAPLGGPLSPYRKDKKLRVNILSATNHRHNILNFHPWQIKTVSQFTNFQKWQANLKSHLRNFLRDKLSANFILYHEKMPLSHRTTEPWITGQKATNPRHIRQERTLKGLQKSEKTNEKREKERKKKTWKCEHNRFTRVDEAVVCQLPRYLSHIR